MFLLADVAAAENAITIIVLCSVVVFLSILNAILVIALNRRNTKLVKSRIDLKPAAEEQKTSDVQPSDVEHTDSEAV